MNKTKEMSNCELITRFMSLCHIRGKNNVLCKDIDNDLNIDIENIRREINDRMSSYDEWSTDL